jgi:hypothetical protein
VSRVGDELHCVVDGCQWTFRLEPPNVGDPTLATVFGIGLMASTAASQFAQHVETVLENHYECHSVVDYLKTITRLRRELDGGY